MKKGFTLAEVMITMTILGVVATIVIPNVYEKYQRKLTVTKVKKMYSTISNAYIIYLAEKRTYLNLRSDDADGANLIYKDFFEPYFQISYVAETDSQKKAQIIGSPFYLLSGEDKITKRDYISQDKYFAFKLKDGGVIWFRGNNGKTDIIPIWYDINGIKKPNTLGKDIFIFSIFKDADDISPFDYEAGRGSTLKNAAEQGCIGKKDGWSCTSWVIAKGNMDYLDCPETLTWEKGKCK